MLVGIDDLRFYTANFSLDLQELAAHNGSDAAKYTVGIGQERMSVPGADEDVVTMAANACLPLLEGMAQRDEDPNAISTILFATETGAALDHQRVSARFVGKMRPAHQASAQRPPECAGHR